MMPTATARKLESAVIVSMLHPRVGATAQATLRVLAGLAANMRPLPAAAAAACCTGPYGTGACDPVYCNGSSCQSVCSFDPGYCYSPGSACWTSSSCGGTCCDCVCNDSNFQWYCYCYG